MAGNASYGSSRRLAAARAHEFNLVSKYPLTYRNREDVTNLPPGVLIVGSKNVLSNVSERIQIRQGYVLDGATSDVASAILASFDWLTRGNSEKHLRAGFLTNAGNDGKLQYRYVDSNGIVTWRDLVTGLSSVSFNFTKFWNTGENLREALFVNGSPQIQAWNGATAEILSTTPNSITKTGTESWEDAGFYVTGNKNIIINNNPYSYTGGEDTTTLTGVTGIPTAEAVGSVVHQAVVTTLNSAFTNGPSATFLNGVIGTLNNQVFLSSLTASNIWISQVNSYTVYTKSSPRQSGEGAMLILDDNIVAFKPQEKYMYVSAGQDLWYNINFELQTSTVGVTYEQVNAEPLKTGRGQGARSQAAVSHMKDNIIVVTNETTIDMIGRMENYFGTPQQRNISDSIKLDVDSYDWTDCSIFYHRYNIYVAVPKEGLVLVYGLITSSWEAPQELPISRFYTVDGELYGHSYSTSESYKLFTGYADRVYDGFTGHPIDSKMVFSYQNFGSRPTLKSASRLYVEGYVNANTVITATLTYELDGCHTTRTFDINGSDRSIVCIPVTDGSLGKTSLGKVKFGGQTSNSLNGLPPKFRVQKTFNNKDFFEASISFEVLGVDNRFEILAFGLNVGQSTQEAVKTRQ